MTDMPSIDTTLHGDLTAGSDLIVVTAPGFDAGGESAAAPLRMSGVTVHHAGARGSRRADEVAALMRGAVGAIVSSDPFTADVFRCSPNLRIVARLGVGTDSIDLDAATASGVIVTTAPGLNDETCADHALAMLLAAARRIVENDASVRRGDWDRGGALTPWDLHGAKVGVVGYGRIGRGVVRRLRGFGTEIRVCDPAVTDDVLACSSLQELLAWADVVTLHVPLSATTERLIGPDEIALMRGDAILVNTSRGGVVDQEALFDALAGGRLRAAALDVFAEEPPRTVEWRRLPNVVLSPHVGGLSVGAIAAMGRRCVEQVLAVLADRPPEGIVNPEVLLRLPALGKRTKMRLARGDGAT